MSELFIIECDGCGQDKVAAPQLMNQKARVRVPQQWATVWLNRNGEAYIAHFCSPQCWADVERSAA